jgi:hypothetical protein
MQPGKLFFEHPCLPFLSLCSLYGIPTPSLSFQLLWLACDLLTLRGSVNISKNNQDVQKGVRDKFQHQWLSREMSYCDVSGYWWLAYMEGAGMFCLL